MIYFFGERNKYILLSLHFSHNALIMLEYIFVKDTFKGHFFIKLNWWKLKKNTRPFFEASQCIKILKSSNNFFHIHGTSCWTRIVWLSGNTLSAPTWLPCSHISAGHLSLSSHSCHTPGYECSVNTGNNISLRADQWQSSSGDHKPIKS